jgi:hypothetical protein
MPAHGHAIINQFLPEVPMMLPGRCEQLTDGQAILHDEQMQKQSRAGPSPLVVIMAVIAAGMLIATVAAVLALTYASNAAATGRGSITMIEEEGDHQVLYFSDFHPQTRFNQVRVSIMGETTPSPLSTYSQATPYNSSAVTYLYPLDMGGEDFISEGDQLVIRFEGSLGSRAVDVLITIVGKNEVVAGVTFLLGGGQAASLDLSRATSMGSPQPLRSWPVQLISSRSQCLRLPYEAGLQPSHSLVIEAKFQLSGDPSRQQDSASLVDAAVDKGYRLRLSGDGTKNQWLEFGVAGASVRSNGMRSANQIDAGDRGNFNVALKEGVWYTAMATYASSIGKMQIYVNNSAGALQLAGEVPSTPSLAGAGTYLYLGAYGAGIPERFLAGTLAYVAIKAM